MLFQSLYKFSRIERSTARPDDNATLRCKKQTIDSVSVSNTSQLILTLSKLLPEANVSYPKRPSPVAIFLPSEVEKNATAFERLLLPEYISNHILQHMIE